MNDQTPPRRSDDELFEMAQDEYQRASRMLDEGRLTAPSRAATVGRLRHLADMIGDAPLRGVVLGDAQELRDAPEPAATAAGARPPGSRTAREEPSAGLRHAQSLAALAWEDDGDIEARRARVRDALHGIERMPPGGDTAERRELVELQAQLLRLEAALRDDDASGET